MRIVERDGTLLVRDSPGLHWLLGLLFLGVGSLFVLGPLCTAEGPPRPR